MAKDIEKECPCKAAEELSAEDVENVAGGIENRSGINNPEISKYRLVSSCKSSAGENDGGAPDWIIPKVNGDSIV
mgnify:CR=1 FL=1